MIDRRPPGGGERPRVYRDWLTAPLSQQVEFGRGAGEERGLFGGGTAGADALEGVPQCGVAAAALVDREVALEAGS